MSEFLNTNQSSSGVFTISLNRPEIHNAFNEVLISDLTEVFLKIASDQTIKVVVLTGEGRSFCAGADLNWMKSMVDFTEQENIEDSSKLYTMFDTINSCPKPVIGKINGHTLGGGVGLVSVCDYVITHEKAKFGFTEVRLGLVPAVISKFCINKIGESHARAWFLSGEMFSAFKSKEMGLVHEVTSLDVFEDRFNEVVSSHLKAGPIASVKAKELIKQVLGLPNKEIKEFTCKAIASRRVSDEGQEGMNALLMKRQATWIKND
jgi:methylglutaconyl-CoA hydratase